MDGNARYRYGQWASEISETTSSNWHELGNLVITLERWEEEGLLNGVELFLFTDNATAEAAFWKGTSKSKALFELVLRIKTLEMKGAFEVHVIHVSGRRMIKQGTDGISRGDHAEGVMKGDNMKDFVPIHLNAIEQAPQLLRWLDEVVGTKKWHLLSPEKWFEKHKGQGTYVWAPPPAAAEVVQEELGKSRHLRPHSMHIIIVPRLMTGRWRRHMTRNTDVYIKLETPTIWNLNEQYEPCLVFIALPFMSHKPLLTQRRKLVEDFRSQMRTSGLSKQADGVRWNYVRQFLVEVWKLCTL